MEDTLLKQEFEKLMSKDHEGLLRPEAIIELASSPAHPFHKYFTWDDDEAAHRWRITEAQMLIRSYKIVIEPLSVKVRALTSLYQDRDDGGGYRWTTDVLARPDMRQQLLEVALKELQALESKYAHLEELSRIWDEAREIRNNGR